MPIVPAHAAVPACLVRNLALFTDARSGDFDGMSHSGTYLVIRNKGSLACRVPSLPVVTFRGAVGQMLPAGRRVSAGMHPGPVVVSVAIPAGGRVATGLRWVSGPVYDRNRQLDVRFASILIAGRTLRTPLRAYIYAQGEQPATFDQSPLARLR